VSILFRSKRAEADGNLPGVSTDINSTLHISGDDDAEVAAGFAMGTNGTAQAKAAPALITLANELQHDYPAGTVVVLIRTVETTTNPGVRPINTQKTPLQSTQADTNNDTGKQFTMLTIIIGAAFFLSEVAILYRPEQEMQYYLD
jgi:hypothetical protein